MYCGTQEAIGVHKKGEIQVGYPNIVVDRRRHKSIEETNLHSSYHKDVSHYTRLTRGTPRKVKPDVVTTYRCDEEHTLIKSPTGLLSVLRVDPHFALSRQTFPYLGLKNF